MSMYQSEDEQLTRYLRSLADADAERGASPVVRAQLLEEVRAISAARRRSHLIMSVLAVGLLVPTVLLVAQLALRQPSEVSRASGPGIEMSRHEIATSFFPLFYSDVPISGGQIVRLEVPRASFAAFGVEPLDPTRATRPDLVLADIVVGDDGLARAIRFVRMSNDDQQERLP